MFSIERRINRFRGAQFRGSSPLSLSLLSVCVCDPRKRERADGGTGIRNGGRRPFPFGGVQSTRKSGSPRLLHFRMSLVRHGVGGGGGHRELICPGKNTEIVGDHRRDSTRSNRDRHVAVTSVYSLLGWKILFFFSFFL